MIPEPSAVRSVSIKLNADNSEFRVSALAVLLLTACSSLNCAPAPETRRKSQIPSTGSDVDRSPPPVITIVAPTSDATVRGTVTLRAEVGYGYTDRVSAVTYYIDGARLILVPQPPYETTWNTLTAILGPHEVKAVAEGYWGFDEPVGSTSIGVTVVDDFPTATLLSPPGGATVSGAVPIRADASDDLGITEVRMLVDDIEIASTEASSLESVWDTCALAEGPHAVVAEARDSRGQTSQAENDVTTANLAAAPTLTGRAGDARVRLDWSVCGVFGEFRVFWATAPGVSQFSSSFGSTVHTSLHTGLVNGVVYYYRVAALDGGRLGPLSNEVALTVGPGPTAICTQDGWCWDEPKPQGHDLYTVWGTSSDNVWAAGAAGLVLRWDGISWRIMSPVTATRADFAHFRRLWGSGDDDIWAAGWFTPSVR